MGFFGSSAELGTGIADNGFSLALKSAHAGFYVHKLGVRYFEVTVRGGVAGPIRAEIGVAAPLQAIFFAGAATTSVMLVTPNDGSASRIETSSGTLPLDYIMVHGDVIGITVNFVLATVEVRANDVLLATIPNIETSVLWTQSIKATNSNLLLNIGQAPFAYPLGSSVAWADEEL